MSHELLKTIILNDDTWETVVGINQYINFISGFQAAETLLLIIKEMWSSMAYTYTNATPPFFFWKYKKAFDVP